MTAEEIIDSGLLELYVLGQLDAEESNLVEQSIAKYEVVRAELRDIEKALGQYAMLHSLDVDQSVLDRTIDSINTQNTDSIAREEYHKPSDVGISNKTIWSWLGPLSAIAASIAMIVIFIQIDRLSQLTDDMESLIVECEESQNKLQTQEEIFAGIQSQDNRMILIEPSEKYPETRLIIHNNTVQNINYLQINNLPELSDGLAFQLWSLKGTNEPIPLSVFRRGEDLIIPIEYVDNTDAYAITIEPESGSESPNLEELIGVFVMS